MMNIKVALGQRQRALDRLDSEYITTRNYRRVSVYPSTSDLVFPNLKKLPINVVKGPYTDLAEYLQTHFSLLREDYIKPIREDIISYLKDSNAKLNSVKIHKVQVVWQSVKDGEICTSFEIRQGVTYNSNLWNVNGDSKRFMKGSLLIFTKDNFKTSFCGRVVENKNIRYKKVMVTFEQPVKLSYKQDYLMVECDNFFEPYFYVMKVLQITTSNIFSMQKYLVEAESCIDSPKYLKGIKYSIKDPNLNKSQLVAINAALSQELVIIQGPPGTGKTFLGLKIAKLLLSISRKWYNESPMLVISFTNHALDQFLEGMTEFTKEILRYGGQSKNPQMKNYSLGERRSNYFDTIEGMISKRTMAPLYSAYRDIEESIRAIEIQMENIITSKPNCIVNFNLLASTVQDMGRYFVRKGNEVMVSWLLEEDGTIGEKISSNQMCCLDKDSEKMARIYENHIKNTRKPSKYCLISVSIIESAADKLQNRITEITKETATKKENVNSTRQQETNSLSEIHKYLMRKLQYLKLCLNTDFSNCIDNNKVNWNQPFKIPVYVRWQLYKYWLKCYETHLQEKMDLLIEEYIPIYKEFNEQQKINNLEVMRRQKVIGMTTTSAARLHSTIRALKCPIVIVEEAAEVLEAHIIPVLTEHCQHLILIGDHQQLKPTTADYYIETRHKLGVSLFERMVLNDIQCHTLNVQHRMRPEISSLITPSIYSVLRDHQSVKSFPHIKGMEKSLYFITHEEVEESSGESSKKNVHEAKFLIELAVYLLKNGYGPEDITILTAYLGQVGALTQRQKEHDDSKVKEVRISSVDNFQGEENRIILLSLVRNNNKKKIGFLSIENRVCVALSRAKVGLYIMGNIGHLSTCSELWQKIKLPLESQQALGTSLPLKCQQHGKITMVKTSEDFGLKVPDGGCDKLCKAVLSCGHICLSFCHNVGVLHENYKCMQPCLRLTCNNKSHKCQKKCHQECGPCMYPLGKLSCQHRMKCYMLKTGDYKCRELVDFKFKCGHTRTVHCYETKGNVQCSICKPTRKTEHTFNSICKTMKNLRLRDTSRYAFYETSDEDTSEEEIYYDFSEDD